MWDNEEYEKIKFLDFIKDNEDLNLVKPLTKHVFYYKRPIDPSSRITDYNRVDNKVTIIEKPELVCSRFEEGDLFMDVYPEDVLDSFAKNVFDIKDTSYFNDNLLNMLLWNRNNRRDRQIFNLKNINDIIK